MTRHAMLSPMLRYPLSLVTLLLTTASLDAVESPRAVASDGPHRQYGAWRSCQLGGGGYAQDVRLVPGHPTRIYSYIDVGGVYRSDDEGRTWRMLGATLPAELGITNVRDLEVDPTNPDHLLMATGTTWEATGLWSSRDGGATWKKVLDAHFAGNHDGRWCGRVVVRDPINPSVVLAASLNGGVFRSDDGGDTWTLIPGTTGLHPVDAGFTRNGKAWICSWGQQATVTAAGEAMGRTALLWSTDGGRTFAAAKANRTASEIVPDGDGFVALLDGNTTIARGDGHTWTPFDDGLERKRDGSANRFNHTYQVLGRGPDYWITTSNGRALYRRNDADAAWRRMDAPRLDLGDWWGGPHGVEFDYPFFASSTASITIDPANPQRWWLSDWFAIYRSDDAGASFQLTIDGIESTCVHDLLADPSDPQRVHAAVADIGAFVSNDRGTRFLPPRRMVANNLMRLAINPHQPQQVRATAGHGWECRVLLASDDAGRSWREQAGTGLPPQAARQFADLVADPAAPGRFILLIAGTVTAGGPGSWVTTNAGEAWTWLGDGLPHGQDVFSKNVYHTGRQAACADGATVAIAHEAGTAWVLPKGANRWQAATLPAGWRGKLNAVAVQGRRWYLVGEPGVAISDDGGASFTWSTGGRDAIRQLRSVAVHSQDPRTVAIGGVGGLHLSRDGGATWTLLSQELPYKSNPVLAFAGDRLLAGTVGCGIFRLDR